ncbi:TPA: hypothetical protein MD170_000740 [Klebsiella pneumoniae]|nr:hypothetical protein [Klebsiella pneumoniae]
MSNSTPLSTQSVFPASAGINRFSNTSLQRHIRVPRASGDKPQLVLLPMRC